MSTLFLPAPDATRAFLAGRLEQGDVLHGSQKLDLVTLEPRVSRYLHLNTRTGERMAPMPLVSATAVLNLAIFYGAIHGIIHAAGIQRGSAIKSVRDMRGTVVAYRYFVSERGKQVIAEREEQGAMSAAYFLPRSRLQPNKLDHDLWETPEKVAAFGAVAISAACFRPNVYSLSSPDSDPDIHGFYESNDRPAETPTL